MRKYHICNTVQDQSADGENRFSRMKTYLRRSDVTRYLKKWEGVPGIAVRVEEPDIGVFVHFTSMSWKEGNQYIDEVAGVVRGVIQKAKEGTDEL